MSEPSDGARRQRDKPWIFRTYAGHSTAPRSNALYRNNLAKGQTGLSVAFDLPTQTGYDSDHPLARGEVGKVGVPISHLGDMRTLFDEIPLGEMNTSMTINATAAWLLALYVALADEQGVRAQHAARHHAERHHQGVSLARHLCVSAGALDAADQGHDPVHDPRDAEMESDECLLLSPAGGGRDAGAGARLRARHRDRGARHGEGVGRGRSPAPSARWSGASRSSSMPGCASSPRSARCAPSPSCGTRSRATRYGVTDPKQRLFRYGVQVNSLGLTEQQPENNVSRILIEMLAVTLSKNARARAVQLPAWNEALGLPRPWDQQWSLRMQQILAYETDLLEYGDIFDGSPVIAAKVDGAQARGQGGARAHRSDGRRGRRRRAGLHEAAAGRIEHPPGRGDRARRADRRRRQQVRRERAFAARRRRRCDPHGLAAGRGRADRAAQGLAREPRREGGDGGAEGTARGRAGEPQHHAGLDRLRQSRRHHRRMGLRPARELRRIPRADRRRPRAAQRRPSASTTCAPTSSGCRASSAGG